MMTADELLRLKLPAARTELVRGQLVVREPAGYRHGAVAARLLLAIGGFAEAHGLGTVFTAETGFRLRADPDTVRAPDVAFVRRERLPEPPPRGYAALAPDLVVEVLSPDDRPREVLDKVSDWLESGTTLVWVVDPERRAARVYRIDGSVDELGEADLLLGEAVLPGFACEMRRILD